jgi:hypothetical protein
MCVREWGEPKGVCGRHPPGVGPVAETGGAGVLPFFADLFWLSSSLVDSRGRCAPLAVRLHVRMCVGVSASHGPHGRARAGQR